MIPFEWGGEELHALGEKALWWPRRRTVCVADMHVGKAATFRWAGVPVPETTTAATLDRLALLIARHGATRLVILGDLLHAKAGRAAETMEAVRAWRERHAGLDVLLVRGNHDAHAGDPPGAWRVRVEDESWADDGDGRVVFAHHPERGGQAESGADRHVLCGHIHPAVYMAGPARGMRTPCFWFGRRVGVLPAFGAFTGTKVVFPAAGDQVFAVEPGSWASTPASEEPTRRCIIEVSERVRA